MKNSVTLSLKAVFGLVLWLTVTSLCAAQTYTPQPFSADMTITNQKGEKTKGKYFFSPPSIRMDIATQGQNVSMITDMSTQKGYTLLHSMHMYMETQGGQSNPMMSRSPQPPTFDGTSPCGKDKTCQKAGVETVNGRVCDKWVGTDKQGGTSTAWIDQKLNFPIKSVNADGSGLEFSNVSEGKPDASQFQPPAGYSKMGAGMFPGAPKQ